MKYRTKLYLSFAAFTVAVVLVSRTWFYLEASRLLLQGEKSKAKSLAAAIAATISGDSLEEIQTLKDTDSSDFEELSNELIRIREANRRADIDIRYIYLIRPSPKDPTKVEITLDVGNSSQNVTYKVGEQIWPEASTNGILEHIQKIWATEKIYTDAWGSWLTGIAPIYDSKRQYVATVCVDLSAASVKHDLHHLLILAIVTGSSILFLSLIIATLLAHLVTKSLKKISLAVEEIGRGNLKTRIDLKSRDEFGSLAEALNDMAKGLEENERLKLNFVRYVSKHVMEKILSSDISISLKGERRKITVLFSDIRQFTTLAEKLPPEDVVSLLNEYLDRMLNIIFDNGGTLDKFIGDGLMVEFGAPLDDPNQEKNAVKTAIEMQKALKSLNQKWEKERNLRLSIGIGIHTGFAVVGNIGSERRMEYTAIGDTVNVASRLEHASKELKVPILLSDASVQGLDGQYSVRSLGLIKLEGRQTQIEAFTIDSSMLN